MRIKDNIESKQIINRSEFICYLAKCLDEESCREFINEIRRKHPQATHVCTAYITNHKMTIKTSDDGEPSKTAGMPMLDALQKNDLEDVCACVVRYFGGVKLGAGGLVRAYSSSVAQAITKATLMEVVKCQIYSLRFTYDLVDKLNYFLQDVYIANKNYEEKVEYILYLDDEMMVEKIREFTNGKCELQFLYEEEVEKEVRR
ncbi:MAG: YigZ family protein [Erysipelotrichaceae bacterium]|nr:YigZ family protein [Erysipelotrichaceae bacterium]MDY5252916.1 YigZ family protein [Erysipelotrichaceae bacterium]